VPSSTLTLPKYLPAAVPAGTSIFSSTDWRPPLWIVNPCGRTVNQEFVAGLLPEDTEATYWTGPSLMFRTATARLRVAPAGMVGEIFSGRTYATADSSRSRFFIANSISAWAGSISTGNSCLALAQDD